MNSLQSASLTPSRVRTGMIGLGTLALLYAGYAGATPRSPHVVETLRPVLSTTSAASPAQLVHLEAGTRFDDQRPPEGWSLLVLKSTPRLTSGDLDTLSEEAFTTASRVRLAIVADVAPTPDRGGFALDRVGVGLSAPADGENGDVIVTPRDVEGSKGTWSAKQRIILAAASYELSHAKLIASTPTFALVRIPTRFLLDGEHAKTSLLYAFLVDAASGGLRTFAWRESDQGPPRILHELATPAVIDGALDVKAGKLAGIPITWSFALTAVPGEARIEITPGLAEKLAPGSIETATPDDLEAALTAAATTLRASSAQPADSGTPAL